jgi:hypothetical protein
MEQLEMFGEQKVLQAIRKSQDERNKESRKTFFRFVKFKFRRGTVKVLVPQTWQE